MHVLKVCIYVIMPTRTWVYVQGVMYVCVGGLQTSLGASLGPPLSHCSSGQPLVILALVPRQGAGMGIQLSGPSAQRYVQPGL